MSEGTNVLWGVADVFEKPECNSWLLKFDNLVERVFVCKKKSDFANLSFWRISDFLSVIVRFLVKNYCLEFVYFLFTILGKGVSDSVSVF